MKPRKTLKELSTLDQRFSKNNIDNAIDLAAFDDLGSQLDEIKKAIRETNREYVDQVALIKELNKMIDKRYVTSLKNYKADEVANKVERQHAKNIIKHKTDIAKFEKEILDYKKKQEQEEKAEQKRIEQNIKSQLKKLDILKLFGKEAQDIYKISHEMQLTSNMTWKEFSKNYSEAYDMARKMNTETGKQLHSAKEIIEMQNTLLKDGWKGLDPSTLTNIAGATRLMVTTLGTFPAELSTAFQNGFRQFGTQTDRFITQVGNQINAFSDTFGTSIGMLSGVVSQMSSSNSYLMKSNMEMQLQANENLLKAAALSGSIGLTSSNFISDLALTSQYGTADQMSGIFQGGALLQGFDTSAFQGQMLSGNTDQAISGLFESIYGTMSGLGDDHYLRNEYMQQIGSAFGLSQRDMLQIMANGGNLGAYEEDMQEKLLDVNNSMKDEVRELRISVVDTVKNWWNNTGMVQGFGRVMNELGLHGVSGQLKGIQATLITMMAQNKAGGILGGLKGKGSTGNMMGPLQGGTKGINVPKLGLGALGFAGSQALGSSIQQNQNLSSGVANTGGFLTNVGGGAAAGALMGSAVPLIGTTVGAVVGGTMGLFNSIKGMSDRKTATEEIEDNRRQARKSTTPLTDDPLLNAINRQTDVLENAIGGSTDRLGSVITQVETYKKTTTEGMFK